MPTLLFVCMANQFRSPLAAALFEKRLQETGTAKGWTVASAGTWVKNESGAHPIAILEAEKMGLDLSRHVTREVTHAMIEAADLVIVMTRGQKEALQFEFAGQRRKIVMLTELSGNSEADIPDPAQANFAEADKIVADLYAEIDKAFIAIVRRAGALSLQGCAVPTETKKPERNSI